MGKFPRTIENLLLEFSKFPGIGRKTAEKFVFYLLKQNKSELELLTQALSELQTKTTICEVCGNLSEEHSRCHVCRDSSRDNKIICVVEEIHDLNVIEATHEYHGVYHVLGGTLYPIEGITEAEINIQKLVERLRANAPQEIILALNPDMNGEATIMYLKKLLAEFNIKITRLARGLPMGSDIEYADDITLLSALNNRNSI